MKEWNPDEQAYSASIDDVLVNIERALSALRDFHSTGQVQEYDYRATVIADALCACRGVIKHTYEK